MLPKDLKPIHLPLLPKDLKPIHVPIFPKDLISNLSDQLNCNALNLKTYIACYVLTCRLIR